MSISINVLIVAVIALFYVVIVLISRIMINKFSTLDEIYRRNNKRLATIISLVNKSFEGSIDSLRIMKDLKQNLQIDPNLRTIDTDKLRKLRNAEIKKLHSLRKSRRKEAASALGIIGDETSRLALEDLLKKESNYSVKVYISNALTDIANEKSIEVMLNTLIGAHRWYREKVISNILEFGGACHTHFLNMKGNLDIEEMEFLIKYAGENYNDDTKKYLFDFVERFEEILADSKAYYERKKDQNQTNYKIQYIGNDMDYLLTMACRTIANLYYNDFRAEKYWKNHNKTIRINSFWAISKKGDEDSLKILLANIGETSFEKTIIDAATKMLEENSKLIFIVEQAFANSESIEIKSHLAQILSNRIEYYIMRIGSSKKEEAKAIIAQIINNGIINELIGFLNLNKDKDIENSVVQIIKENVKPESAIGIELRTYLKESVLNSWEVEKYNETQNARVHAKDKKLLKAVVIASLFGAFMVPVVFVIRYFEYFQIWNLRRLLSTYVIDFNYGLAYYSIAVSMSYIILMCLSYINVRKQARLWNLKNISMLFRKKMLPSISIVAPAYNEEKTIVASVKSLLNLKYPDYELVVVNDGSKDDTLGRLIEAFKLIRVNYIYKSSLDTAPIRGIYRNPSYPKLIVIDKSNGGKADALNSGINVANKDFFCGIDADSLLEPEALLRLASLTIDESKETPALGGNIFPINGCTIDNGMISKIEIPKNNLARFQNIEYLRAFMTGRLGWQQINSLLIISGAFGLFRKERIVGIGGYMTSAGKYHKDTVGEDMELVVRISRMMHELKLNFRILYAYNANCWTQVPEDMKSLKTQRYRWQRGLIDIMFFHKKMIFNPRYKTTGMLAMPYYLIFELLGPMFEIQGYIMVLLAAFLGILDARIALLLFIGTVLLGIINSISAVLIAEREQHYYGFKDLIKLIFYATIENFGPRQWISLWRIRGQLNYIFGKGGWGKIARKELK